MRPLLKFENKVAVVTGAGGGLGKAYALLLASRGAKVVVNDLGGSAAGDGKNSVAADQVVKEIKKLGGTAVADYNSVEEGDKIIETALQKFGRIDILINNAGILRDRSFARLSDTDWDLVHRVHLRGSFLVTHAAWPHLKKQNFGRIIMTSSVAGLFGNFGQANYSAAKMGLIGLSNTLAIEGQKYNIHTNVVVPMGGTRLTEGILPPDLFEEMKPELIAPLVAYLCHEDCQENGAIVEAAAGWFGKYRWERSKGHVCRGNLSELVTPEAVQEHWDKIGNFTGSLHPSSNEEAAGLLAMMIEDTREGGSLTGGTSPGNPGPPASSNPSGSSASGPMSVIGHKESPVLYSYDAKDIILYALAVGTSTRDSDYLKYLFEGSEEFSALPTFAVMPSFAAFFQSSIFTGGFSGWDINLANILHGEQYIELLKPIPVNATLKSSLTVADILDKGSGAVIIGDVVTSDEKDDVVAKSQFSVFVVGEGNFGGARQSKKAVPVLDHPAREPDVVTEFKTSVDQAALYRLCGDRNPLHIDPSFAAMGGFSKPILHGLCFFGIAARTVLEKMCGNDISRFRAIKGRFASPVIPGQTLVTRMWKEKDRVFFKMTIKETGKDCLTGGYVDLSASTSEEGEAKPVLECLPVFDIIAERLKTNPDIAKSIKAIFLWNINLNKELATQFTVDLRSSLPAVYEGPPRNGQKADVTLTLEDSDFIALASGSMNPQKAFMSGKLKLAGNMMLAQKLQMILKDQSKL